MAGTRTKQRQVKASNVAERQQQCFDLRKEGWSYRDIGEKLEISYNTVRNDCNAVMDRLHEETMEEAIKYRAVQVNRLNDLLKLHRSIADDPGHKDYQVSSDKVLKIETMLMKLMGTEELPIQRIESTSNDAIVIEYVGIEDKNGNEQ